MQGKGHGTAFGDIEGELLYMLVRESRPSTVFEISPDCGWSTNYILAGLNANNKGLLHTFELAPKKRGKTTSEVILNNQVVGYDRSRISIHIGDAVEHVPRVIEKIDFILIDSCHDEWFADWYINTVFPRVEGIAFVQDISFIDMLEPSAEADYFWHWAASNGICLNLVGLIEADTEIRYLRQPVAERRSFRSNSVVFELPNKSRCNLPELSKGPMPIIQEAHEHAPSRPAYALSLLNQASHYLHIDNSRSTGYREMFILGREYQLLGNSGEAQRQYQRALSRALEGGIQQQSKALVELVGRLGTIRQYPLMLKALIMLPFTGIHWFRALFRLVLFRLKRD